MSGRLEAAQLAQGCPLDGVVRCHCSPLGSCATSGGRSNAADGGACIACHLEPRRTSRQMHGLRRCLRAAQACQRAVIAGVPRSRARDSTMLQQANGGAPCDCDRRAPHPARAATRKEQPCSRRSEAEAHVGPNVEVSGGLKRAQRALGCPLDWQVRRSRVDRQCRTGGERRLETTPARTPVGGRAVCQSVPVLHDQIAPRLQRAHV